MKCIWCEKKDAIVLPLGANLCLECATMQSRPVSRLDYFAGHAMQAMIASDRYSFAVGGRVEALCALSKDIAIAMLNELDKPNATS